MSGTAADPSGMTQAQIEEAARLQAEQLRAAQGGIPCTFTVPSEERQADMNEAVKRPPPFEAQPDFVKPQAAGADTSLSSASSADSGDTRSTTSLSVAMGNPQSQTTFHSEQPLKKLNFVSATGDANPFGNIEGRRFYVYEEGVPQEGQPATVQASPPSLQELLRKAPAQLTEADFGAAPPLKPAKLPPSVTLDLIRVAAEMLADTAERFRREPTTMNASPLNVHGVLDYATAAQMITTAMHHLDESIPNGQKERTEQSMTLLRLGATQLGAWLDAKGYQVAGKQVPWPMPRHDNNLITGEPAAPPEAHAQYAMGLAMRALGEQAAEIEALKRALKSSERAVEEMLCGGPSAKPGLGSVFADDSAIPEGWNIERWTGAAENPDDFPGIAVRPPESVGGYREVFVYRGWPHNTRAGADVLWALCDALLRQGEAKDAQRNEAKRGAP